MEVSSTGIKLLANERSNGLQPTARLCIASPVIATPTLDPAIHRAPIAEMMKDSRARRRSLLLGDCHRSRKLDEAGSIPRRTIICTTPRRVRRYPVSARVQPKRLLMYCGKSWFVATNSGARIMAMAMMTAMMGFLREVSESWRWWRDSDRRDFVV